MEDNLIEIKAGGIRVWIPEDQDVEKVWEKVKEMVDIYLGIETVYRFEAQKEEKKEKKKGKKTQKSWSDEEEEIIANNSDKNPKELRRLLKESGYDRSYGACYQKKLELKKVAEPEESEEEQEKEQEDKLEGWNNLVGNVYYSVYDDAMYLVRDTHEGMRPIGEWDLELLDSVFNHLPEEANEDAVEEACARNGLGFPDMVYLMQFYHNYVRYDAELVRDRGEFRLIKEQYSINREQKDKLETERDLIDNTGT